MNMLRRSSSRVAGLLRAADRIAENMQGQDVERRDTPAARRFGRDMAALTDTHRGHGMHSMSFR